MTEQRPGELGRLLAEAAAKRRAAEAARQAEAAEAADAQARRKAARAEQSERDRRHYAVRVLLATPCPDHGAEPGQPCSGTVAICEDRAARVARRLQLKKKKAKRR